MNPSIYVQVEQAYDLLYAPPSELATLRVAIVHYWFVGRAGGEHVVEALADIFPQADLFTLVARPEVMADSLKEHKLTTSFFATHSVCSQVPSPHPLAAALGA